MSRRASTPIVIATASLLEGGFSQLQGGGAVDKIRGLLIQVRNELQRTKREAAAAENAEIAAWKVEKSKQRGEINDMKIKWQATYTTKAQLWLSYGDNFRLEGTFQLKEARWKARQDRAEINLSFETVVCADQDKDYKANSKKRYGQLAQIKKALNLLAKFGLGGKYGKMVRESIKDINAGLCRAFDDYSKWVSLSNLPTDLNNRRPTGSFRYKKDWNVYNSTHKDVCVSKISYTVTCYTHCDIRIMDSRLAGGSGVNKHWARVVEIKKDFGKSRKVTLRLKKPITFAKTRDMNYVKNTKGKLAKRTDFAIYVVPDCNCRPTGAVAVTADQSNTAKTDAKQAAESKSKSAATKSPTAKSNPKSSKSAKKKSLLQKEKKLSNTEITDMALDYAPSDDM
jgi:hypothetical protein